MCKNPKISVIVPVYNSERYLDTCMESILQQDDDNYEVILVNDGSKDGSLRLIEQYCASYPFVRCINKENGGVSSARNAGIDSANGEFVVFIDSDDVVKEGYFRFLRELQLQTNADIVTSEVRAASLSDKETPEKENILVQRKEYLDFEKHLFNGSVCGKLFKRSIIGDIRFKVGIYYEEDSLFVCQTVKNAQTVAISYKCFYQYVLNLDSATHHYSKEKLYTRFQAREEIARLLSDMPGNIDRNARIEMAVCAVKILLLTSKEYSGKDEHDRMLHKTVKRDISLLLKSYIGGKLKVASVLVMLSPSFAAWTMRTIEKMKKKSFRDNIAQLEE